MKTQTRKRETKNEYTTNAKDELDTLKFLVKILNMQKRQKQKKW